MRKTINEPEIREQVIKNVYKKPITNIMLSGETLKAFSVNSVNLQSCYLHFQLYWKFWSVYIHTRTDTQINTHIHTNIERFTLYHLSSWKTLQINTSINYFVLRSLYMSTTQKPITCTNQQ